jgi:nucleotide-binding universal stress UspA family protein
MNRMLVALDDSPRAARVLETAIDLSRRTDAELVLFRAVALPVGVPVEAWAISGEDLPRLLERKAREQLAMLALRVPRERLAGLRVTVGTAWNEICRAAHEERVDLIVIGSHGYGGIDRLLGTTASRIVNHADCSVLVARDPRNPAP